MSSNSAFFLVERKTLFGNLHLPKSRNPPCVITLHGLESSKDGTKWPMIATRLCRVGIACFRFSFRGCGEGLLKSEGRFSDTTLTNRIKDFSMALKFLADLKQVNMGRLGIIGSSFGGMVAVASNITPFHALVLLSTPYTLGEIMNQPVNGEKYHYLPSGNKVKREFFIDLQQYDLLENMKTLSPTLIIHGGKDQLVPVEHAFKLYNYSKTPKKIQIIRGADHRFSQIKHRDKMSKFIIEWFTKWL